MKRSEIIKYAAIFVIIMFILSMFYNISFVTPSSERGEGNIVIGKAVASCKITSYSTEITIEPWSERAQKIADELKAAGYIDYINKAGNVGALVFSSKANIEKIRNAYLNENVNVLSLSSCVVNEAVPFQLQNGSERNEVPGVIKIYTDPFNKVGEKINLDLIAYFMDEKMINLRAEPFTQTDIGVINATLRCYELYAIGSSVEWEKRNMNLTKLYEIVGESEVNYTKNDEIRFGRELNSSEVSAVKEALAERGINATVYPQGMLTDEEEKGIVNEVVGKYTGIYYPYSTLIVYAQKEKLDDIKRILDEDGIKYIVKKACEIKTDAIGERLDSNPIFVPVKLREMRYYIEEEKIQEEKIKIRVKLELLGAVAESIEFLGIE
ncbi:MAG: hypothetical protein NZ903_00225 [Candidatus Micrarchaeota archaeon]|nr:hypothetical protein [Candidatus Micrarchaeota archaeon]